MTVNIRRFLPFLAVGAMLLAAPSASHASLRALTEVAPLTDAKASCPGFEPKDCAIIVVRQTGFQAKVTTTRNYAVAKTNGSLVAWTVSLYAPSATDSKKLSDGYGGTPKIAVVVLEPQSGKGANYKVVQKGPLVDVSKYLGSTPTFALPEALPVKKGQVVGITVPTWAPILHLGFGPDTSWRSSRPLKETLAGDFSKQQALVGSNEKGSFKALYQRARLAYSAIMVPTPKTVATTTTKKKAPAKRSAARR